jgi:hypothetical protein
LVLGRYNFAGTYRRTVVLVGVYFMRMADIIDYNAIGALITSPFPPTLTAVEDGIIMT